MCVVSEIMQVVWPSAVGMCDAVALQSQYNVVSVQIHSAPPVLSYPCLCSYPNVLPCCDVTATVLLLAAHRLCSVGVYLEQLSSCDL